MGFKKINHISMIGATGIERVLIDPLLKQQVEYYTIVNLTDNQISIYPLYGNVNDSPSIKIGQFQTISMPLSNLFREGFILKWLAVNDLTINKNMDVIFSENDLQQNNSYAPSFQENGITNNIAIDTDNVGLMKQTQLPLVLGVNGGLNVEIIDSIDIGSSDKLQVITGGANAVTTLTFGAVANKSNYITGFDLFTEGAVTSSPILIELKDGATVIKSYKIPVGSAIGTLISKEFTYALKGGVNSAITLNISAGGAGCIVSANMAGYTK